MTDNKEVIEQDPGIELAPIPANEKSENGIKAGEVLEEV